MGTTAQSKSQKKTSNQNPLETLKDFGSSTVKNAGDAFKQMGSNMFDQLIGYNSVDDEENNYMEKFSSSPKNFEKNKAPKREFPLFNYQEHYENKVVREQIKQLTESIKQEIEMVRKADKSLLSELNDIQKLAIDSLPEKPGIYHIRFLEIVLSLLRNIRAKIGESRTWMQALATKKKKRGSLFASLSKKKGTQYSMSQELSSARSVQ